MDTKIALNPNDVEWDVQVALNGVQRDQLHDVRLALAHCFGNTCLPSLLYQGRAQRLTLASLVMLTPGISMPVWTQLLAQRVWRASFAYLGVTVQAANADGSVQHRRTFTLADYCLAHAEPGLTLTQVRLAITVSNNHSLAKIYNKLRFTLPWVWEPSRQDGFGLTAQACTVLPCGIHALAERITALTWCLSGGPAFLTWEFRDVNTNIVTDLTYGWPDYQAWLHVQTHAAQQTVI